MGDIVLIFVVTPLVYYIMMACKTSDDFKKDGKRIPVRTALYLPYYITKMSMTTIRNGKVLRVEWVFDTLKVIAKYDIFLVVYLEIVKSQNEGSVRLTHKDSVNKELKGTYTSFLRDWEQENGSI